MFDHSVMAAVQGVYGWLGSVGDVIAAVFTFLGEETFIFILITLIYWCLNKKLGEFLMLSLYVNIAANGIAKDIVRRARPFLNADYADMRYVRIDNALVDTVSLKDSFSFPSGHAQTAGAQFGALALWIKKTWVRVLSVLLIVAVMFSRVYLGVHYPTDVIVGGIAGVLLAVAAFILFNKFYDKKLWLFAAAVAFSALALLLDFSADTLKSVTMGLGMLLGLVLETKTVCFKTGGAAVKKIARFVLGFALLMALRFGLKAAFPDEMLFHGIRYFILGLFAVYIWPLVFTKLKL